MSSFIDRPKYSCALGGAIATLNALPGAVPILHAAPGCGLNLSYAINGGSGYVGSGYCGGTALSSSNVCENEIVFGGEARLIEQIEKTIELVDGELYFVVSGCMVEMIGDDITGAARNVSAEGVTILAAETGGFKGNSYRGYDIVLQTLFREFTQISETKDETLVNLWGIVPAHDVFWKGNLTILETLLSKLGIKVNTFFGEGKTLNEIKSCGNAVLNIVVSDTYGIEAAQVFEEVHGTPYIQVGLPIGAHGTDRFLGEIASALDLEPALIEKITQDERQNYFQYLSRISDLYNDYDIQRYAVIVSDSNYSPALTRFVADDLGWLPEVVVITDLFRDEADKQKVLRRFEGIRSDISPEIIFDPNEAALLPYIKNHWPVDHSHKYYDSFSPAVILGSSFELDLANDLKLPMLCISYPVTNRVVLNRGYAGYEGALSLVEDLLSTLISAR